MGKQRTFRAAAADQETGRALIDCAVHQRVQRIGVELAVLIKGRNGGDKETAHVFHFLHVSYTSFICADRPSPLGKVDRRRRDG